MPHTECALGYDEPSQDSKARLDLLLNMGESYRIIGRYQEAEEMYREALQLNAHHTAHLP